MNKGFTLMELMIVMAIIGIIAAVAIPLYQAYQNKKYGYGIYIKTCPSCNRPY